MDDDAGQARLGKALIALGAIGLVFYFVGPAFVDEAATGFLLFPALIVLFIGRGLDRRARRRPIDDIAETPEPVQRPQSDRNPRPRPRPAPRPSLEPADRARVKADLEEALAPYRTEPMPDATPPPEVVETLSDEFRPMTSAEMIAEAKRRLTES